MSSIQLNERISVTPSIAPFIPTTLEDCCHVESRLTVKFKEHTFPLATYLNYRDGKTEHHRVHITLADVESTAKGLVGKNMMEWIPEYLSKEFTDSELELLLSAGWDNMPPIIKNNFKMIGSGTLNRDSDKIPTFGCEVNKL